MPKTSEPVVKVKDGKKLDEYKSKTEAAVQNGYSVPGMMALVTNGNTSRDGSVYMLVSDWEAVQAGQMPMPKKERPKGKYAIAGDAVPQAPAIVEVVRDPFELGISNTPKMLEWLKECREDLSERIPPRERVDTQVERTLADDRKHLKITVRIQLIMSNTSMADMQYIFDTGWQSAQPWSDARRHIAFYKQAVFEVQE